MNRCKSSFLLLLLISAPAYSGESTTFEERQGFLDRNLSLATAIGVAQFCGNASDEKELKQLSVSSAVDSHISKGPQMYGAVREVVQHLDSHSTGVANGLLLSKISGSSRLAVCTEGAEMADKLLRRSGP